MIRLEFDGMWPREGEERDERKAEAIDVVEVVVVWNDALVRRGVDIRLFREDPTAQYHRRNQRGRVGRCAKLERFASLGR